MNESPLITYAVVTIPSGSGSMRRSHWLFQFNQRLIRSEIYSKSAAEDVS